MKNAFSYYKKTKNSNIPKNLKTFIDMKIKPVKRTLKRLLELL